MASASDGVTPSVAAIEPTSEGLTVSPGGTGAPGPPPLDGVAGDTISVVALLVAGALTPEPCSVVPAMSRPDGFRPLAAASELTLTPSRDAIALSVSPRWTTNAPSPLDATGAAVSVAELTPSDVAPEAF